MVSPADSPETKNLVLVTHPGRQDWRDFGAIAQEIARMASDIFVYIVSPRDSADTIEDWGRRSLIVSFDALGDFKPARGRLCQSAWIAKYDEYLLFSTAGVRTPFTSVFRLGRSFDFSGHRPLVVAKPTKMGAMSHGDQVVLMRRERVQEVVPARFPPELSSDEAPVIIQDFVDTAKRPEQFRVLALFGEPLYCFKATSTVERPDLDAADAELESGHVVTNSYDRTVEFVADSEVIEFAKAACRAIWWIPLHGLDIIREAESGALHVLECNPGGNTWGFSSKLGEHTRSLVGGVDPFKNQFGAWNVAAKALIKATRFWAE